MALVWFSSGSYSYHPVLYLASLCTLQDKRESVYSKLNKQEANTIPLLNKSKRPQAQDSKE